VHFMLMDKYNILIVDDEDCIVQLLYHALKFNNYQLFMANDVVSALDIYEKESIDLVITDMCMPGAHGLTFVRTLKDNDSHKSIPVIVITGYQDEEVIHELHQSGIKDILFKPFNLKTVCQKVEMNLSAAIL